MKLFFLILFFGCICFFQKYEKIQWKNSHSLSWEDFKARPNPDSAFNANTNSGISFGYKISGTPDFPRLSFEVIANFYPQLSWVNPNSKNEYLLHHENSKYEVKGMRYGVKGKRYEVKGTRYKVRGTR